MQLQARIVVMTESVDKPFYYTKDHEEIQNILGFAANSMGSWDIEVGKKITIKGEECTVKGFQMRVYPETNEPHNYGINLHREGTDYPYNIDIIILVNDEAIRLRFV